jgi:hypothetical protein
MDTFLPLFDSPMTEKYSAVSVPWLNLFVAQRCNITVKEEWVKYAGSVGKSQISWDLSDRS